MKYFSFKILILSILLPPILYIASVHLIELYMEDHLKNEIEEIYMGDTQPLFKGLIHIKDAIANNIDNYLKDKNLRPLGIWMEVMVTTKQGIILYPSTFYEDSSLIDNSPNQIASENYRLMNQGFVINLDINLHNNTILTNSLLLLYILASILFLYYYYLKSIKKNRLEYIKINKEIDRLSSLEDKYKNKINVLKQDNKKVSLEFKRIKKELESSKITASKTEDEMLSEIIALEDKIQESIRLHDEQLKENSLLQEQVTIYEQNKGHKKKETKFLSKRFKALYKNVDIHEKAVSGFLILKDDMRIKSEEIIFQLNVTPDVIPIKRKLATKKGRKAVFEVAFSYSGRLYFRKIKNNRIEILAIGSKKTQLRDIAFIESVAKA